MLRSRGTRVGETLSDEVDVGPAEAAADGGPRRDGVEAAGWEVAVMVEAAFASFFSTLHSGDGKCLSQEEACVEEQGQLLRILAGWRLDRIGS